MDCSALSEHYLHNVVSFPVQAISVRDRMRRYVNLAKALFSKGACSHGRTMNFTFVARKSKLIVIGMNDYRRQVKYVQLLGRDYRITKGEPTYNPCLHSEMSAVLKLGLDDCSDLDFYNIRLDRNRQCRNSCCCANCLSVLNAVGFKHLYFYDGQMNIRSMA